MIILTATEAVMRCHSGATLTYRRNGPVAPTAESAKRTTRMSNRPARISQAESTLLSFVGGGRSLDHQGALPVAVPPRAATRSVEDRGRDIPWPFAVEVRRAAQDELHCATLGS